MGRGELSPAEQKYLQFGAAFEEQLVHQEAARTIEESMAVGWKILRLLPALRFVEEQLELYELEEATRVHSARTP
jgi:vacuolar-type H+-ATPase subunit B/Vma2